MDAETKAEFARLDTEVREVKTLLTGIHQLLARIDGRMDEQARRLDDRSRVMTARIAAVPGGN